MNRILRNAKFSDELKAFMTTHKNLKKQIEYDKKLGYKFAPEIRNGKEYLYKQKKVDGKKEHKYIAKNWKDLDTKQFHQAQEEVWNDEWALKNLSPSDIETFDMIAKETETIQYHREFLKLFKTKKEKEELMVENHILEQFERNKRGPLC